jgi:hypothetical protein
MLLFEERGNQRSWIASSQALLAMTLKYQSAFPQHWAFTHNPVPVTSGAAIAKLRALAFLIQTV